MRWPWPSKMPLRQSSPRYRQKMLYLGAVLWSKKKGKSHLEPGLANRAGNINPVTLTLTNLTCWTFNFFGVGEEACFKSLTVDWFPDQIGGSFQCHETRPKIFLIGLMCLAPNFISVEKDCGFNGTHFKL